MLFFRKVQTILQIENDAHTTRVDSLALPEYYQIYLCAAQTFLLLGG